MMREITVIIAALVLVMGGSAFSIYEITKYNCAAYNAATERPTRFVFGSCYAKFDNGWFDIEQIRSNNVNVNVKGVQS